MGNTKNYKMIISYDGTRYYGWEHQPNTDMTIQGKLENVLSQMIGADVEVIGAEYMLREWLLMYIWILICQKTRYVII